MTYLIAHLLAACTISALPRCDCESVLFEWGSPRVLQVQNHFPVESWNMAPICPCDHASARAVMQCSHGGQNNHDRSSILNFIRNCMQCTHNHRVHRVLSASNRRVSYLTDVTVQFQTDHDFQPQANLVMSPVHACATMACV